MKKSIFVALLILFHFFASGNDSDFITNYSITEGNDTISFIRIAKDNVEKPTIIFCQGSLPVPVVINSQGSKWVPALSNFDFFSHLDRYHYVIISMPNIPICVDEEKLNNRYEYTPKGNYVEEYRQNDYLEKYVERGNAVLKFLRQQEWVKKNKIITVGHSQGSFVALELGLQNVDIHAVGCLSFNILGRYSQFILKQRNAVRYGIITDSIAQKNIDEKYEWWQNVCRDTTEFETGNTKRTWRSFSRPFVDDIVNLKMPVYVAFGTEDDGASMCDLLPLFFELKGKHNYKIHAFIGCGHNFEQILPDGKSDYENMHWQDVMDEFIDWCEKTDLY